MNRDEAMRRLTEVIRRKHLALTTETGYCDNLKGLPAHLSSEQKLERFLTDLATKDVAASTQNQAVNARQQRERYYLSPSGLGVPQGRQKIAHRFIGGDGGFREVQSPGGGERGPECKFGPLRKMRARELSIFFFRPCRDCLCWCFCTHR
jgi:hypothetical protein